MKLPLRLPCDCGGVAIPHIGVADSTYKPGTYAVYPCWKCQKCGKQNGNAGRKTLANQLRSIRMFLFSINRSPFVVVYEEQKL
jgi:hypothetical protein